MQTRLMVIAEVTFENAAQMFVIENDHVVEALATYAANESLGIWILPGASRSREHFFDAHSFNTVAEVATVNSVSITDQIAWRTVFRKCFNHLLRSPSSSRMVSDIKVNHSAPFMRQNNEHKQYAEPGCRHREEVDRDQIANVIVQEGTPRLGRRCAALRHQSGNSTFGNVDAEFEQFAMNSW